MPHRYKTPTTVVLTAACAALLTAFAAPVSAQAFPNKPIRFVIPFPAGSASDTVYRPVLEHMSKTLGQNVLLDPRPGGGGTVAVAHMKTLPADGYAFYLASNTLVAQSLRRDALVDIRRDFSPIGPATDSALVVAVNADLNIKTLKDLVERARANPGKLNYSSYGIGSGAHVFMELLKQEAKIFMLHIPYQSTAAATADAAAGRVEVTGTVLSTARAFVAEFGGSGKLRLIAVGSTERSPLMPGVPGMKESGFPQIDFSLWGGFVGPAGLPEAVVETLVRAKEAAYKDPKIMELVARFGQVPRPGGASDLARIINREYDALARLIKEYGLTLE